MSQMTKKNKHAVDQTQFRTYKEFIAKGEHPLFAFLMASIESKKVQSVIMREKRNEVSL